jgi:hypothetical protein
LFLCRLRVDRRESYAAFRASSGCEGSVTRNYAVELVHHYRVDREVELASKALSFSLVSIMK